MSLLESMYIRQCIDLLEGLILSSETNGSKYFTCPSTILRHNADFNPHPFLMAGLLTNGHVEKLFLFSLMWSLGAVLELDGRAALQAYILYHPSNLDWPKCQVCSQFTRIHSSRVSNFQLSLFR